MSEKPRAGLVRELDTVGIDLQNLDNVGVVGTHHMQTHLRRENQAAALQIHTVSRHQTSGSAQRHAETSLQSPSSNAAIKLLHRSFLPARERERLLAAALLVGWNKIKIYYGLFTCMFKAKGTFLSNKLCTVDDTNAQQRCLEASFKQLMKCPEMISVLHVFVCQRRLSQFSDRIESDLRVLTARLAAA